MKYNEDKILYELIDYVKSTYNQHYSDSGSGFQIQDIFKELNIGREFAQANAIKYLCRYGKKHGKNKYSWNYCYGRCSVYRNKYSRRDRIR